MKPFALFTALAAALCATSCGDWASVDFKNFDYNLQGTWVSHDASEYYSGTLVITGDRITITGYGQDQTPFWTDDARRPFRDFMKGIALKGYAEDNKFYIEDAGVVQEGIPYQHWEDTPPPEYKRLQFLRFNFGGRNETLRKE